MSRPPMGGFAGSVMFAVFQIGWGLAFIWGPIADRFGRSRLLAASVLVYAVFTGAVDCLHLGIVLDSMRHENEGNAPAGIRLGGMTLRPTTLLAAI